MELTPELLAEFDELVSHYPERRAALIPALHRCQEELGGWLAPETMEAVAAYFELEPVEVYGVVTFYPMFRTLPPGKHVVKVCHNVSCMLRGAEEILAKVCELTGAGAHATSADGRFSVETVECQGACASAPMIDLDDVYHENLTPRRVEELIGGLS